MAPRKEERWMDEQQQLRTRIITHDQLGFQWPPTHRNPHEQEESKQQPAADEAASSSPRPPLTRIGGVDLSFVGNESDLACAALIVVAFPPDEQGEMRVLYEEYEMVRLTQPYMPGFLAFREAPPLLALWQRMLEERPELKPQLLMVDGNGVLHPRGVGLASHLGVLADVPTIGIGKNLHMVDGLTRGDVERRAAATLKQAGDTFELRGDSGAVLGACLRATNAATKPVYVSIGHRISLPTAVEIVRQCCAFRVATPVRLADLKSREFIRQWLAKQQPSGPAAAVDGAGIAGGSQSSASHSSANG